MINLNKRQLLFGGASLSFGVRPVKATDGASLLQEVSSAQWQVLKIGAGGLVTGSTVADDNTYAIRSDVFGAYLWNPTAASPKGNAGQTGAFQQLINANSVPSSLLTALSVPPRENGSATGVYELQIAPSNSQIAFAIWAGYLVKTTNLLSALGGTNNWSRVTGFSIAPIYNGANDQGFSFWSPKMAVHPTNPNIVLVGTPENGIYACTDGTTFSQISTGQMPVSTISGGIHPGHLVAFNPSDGAKAYAQSYGNGIYYSNNANTGASSTWAHINSGSGPATVMYLAVSITNALWCVDTDHNLWSYINGTWTEQISDNTVGAVACDPGNGSHVIAVQNVSSNNSLNETFGSGFSGWSLFSASLTDIPWINANAPYEIGPYGLFFDRVRPNTLHANCNQTFFNATWTGNIATGTTVAWTSQGVGIEELVTNCIVVGSAGVRVGCWDFGLFAPSLTRYATVRGPIATPPAGICAVWSIDVAKNNPSFLAYIADAAYVGSTAERSGYSTDGGVTFNPWPGGNPSWFVFKGSAFTDSVSGSVAASTPTNIVWAPCNGYQPAYTTDGGNNWSKVALPGQSSYFIGGNYYGNNRAVCADPMSANTFYLLFMTVGIFSTSNGGATWSQIYNSLTDRAHNFTFKTDGAQLQAMPGQTGHLFFSADNLNYGSLWSSNGGVSWSPFPTNTRGLPNSDRCFSLGFGAAASGSSYPTIYIVGIVNSVYGIYYATNGGVGGNFNWARLGGTIYPNNDIDRIKCISGDPNVYGRVYVGFGGSGFAQFN